MGKSKLDKSIFLKQVDLENAEEAKKFLNILKNQYQNVPYEAQLDDLRNSSYSFFWAMKGEDIIGISGFYKKTPTLAETVKTIVLKDFRGQGYGTVLSLKIEEECLRQGIKKVMTTIYASNVAMVTIKLKQGYKIEGFHPDHEAPGWDEYSLGKVL